MNRQRAETSAKFLVALMREVLIPEKDDLMLDQGIVNFLKLMVASGCPRSTPKISAPIRRVMGFTSMT